MRAVYPPMHVLLNVHAGGDADLTRQAVQLHPDATLVEADDLMAAAELVARGGADLVVAAGGDGTVHAVANGLMRVGASAGERPALGVLPMGTGNDFARTLSMPLGALTADNLELLATGERRALDLIHVGCTSAGECYAINACSGGFTGQIDEEMTPELKAAWGPLAYAIGTARALPGIEHYSATVSWDDGEAELVEAFNVVVANGRTIGGGTPIAPHANPEDGLLDVVVMRKGGALDLARLTAKAYALPDYTQDSKIIHRCVRRVVVASEPNMLFNVDGESHGRETVTFEAVPGALRVVVGPEYAAVPA